MIVKLYTNLYKKHLRALTDEEAAEWGVVKIPDKYAEGVKAAYDAELEETAAQTE